METTKQKILLTGGNGFLGSYIIRGLLKKGYSDISITLRKGSQTELIQDLLPKLKLIETDINDLKGIEGAIENAEKVIHAGALVSFDPKDQDKLFKVNMEGTANIVNSCLQSKTQKLIYISSVAALGRSNKKNFIDEKSIWSSDERNTNYSITKHLAEQEVWRGFHEGLDCAIINPSIILGAGLWKSGSLGIINEVFKGLPYYPTGSTGIVDVRDVADMAIALLESPISGERFICNGKNIAYANLFNDMAKVLKVKGPTKALPAFLAGFTWRIFWLKSKLFGGKATVTKESIKNSFSIHNYDNSKAIEILNFEFRNYENTIKESCESFLNSKENNKAFGFLEY